MSEKAVILPVTLLIPISVKISSFSYNLTTITWNKKNDNSGMTVLYYEISITRISDNNKLL